MTTAPNSRVRQVPLGESAVGEIIRAVEAGLVLQVEHPNFGGTLTAGISRRADGSRVYETIAQGCSVDVGDTFPSVLELARSFTYQVGNRRPYWAAVAALAGSDLSSEKSTAPC